MLLPKKVKFRKWQTGRENPKKVGFETRGTDLAFGSFGLKALGAGRVKSNQLEAARKVISREASKTGKMWIRVFPDKPRTQKGAEVGMGGGAGALSHFVVSVEAGRILFEMDGVTKTAAQEAFRLASHKLPLDTRFVEKGVV